MADKFRRTRPARAINGPRWPRRPACGEKAKIPLFIVGVDAVRDATCDRLNPTGPGSGALRFPHRPDADPFRQQTPKMWSPASRRPPLSNRTPRAQAAAFRPAPG